MCDIPKNCLRQTRKLLLRNGRSSCLQASSLKGSATAQLEQAAVSNKNYVLSEPAGGLLTTVSTVTKILPSFNLVKGKKKPVYFQVLWKME